MDEHRHGFKHVGYIAHTSKHYKLSASPITAKVYRCDCGAICRNLTPAGWQQIQEFGDIYDEVVGISGDGWQYLDAQQGEKGQDDG